MKGSDVVFAVMTTSEKNEYSVDELLRLCSPFKINESLVRTTLSRMSAKGLLDSRRLGKAAYYSFTGKARTLKHNVASSFKSLDWRDWDNKWWGISFSVPDIEKPERHYIRTKLSAYRFAALHPGFWVRPLNRLERMEHYLKSVFSNKHCRATQFEFLNAVSGEDVSRLWNLHGVNERMILGLKIIHESRARISGFHPRKAFVEKITVGSEIVNILFKDPLLPEIYLPKDWRAEDLKTEFANWNEEVQKFSKPFLLDTLNGGK